VGLELVKAVQDYVLPSLCKDTRAGLLLDEKVSRGELGAKTGRGFYDWTFRDINTAKARRDEFLIRFLREQLKGLSQTHGNGG
jgi:3-hydroxybutyryl-CoA dehydrogenase